MDYSITVDFKHFFEMQKNASSLSPKLLTPKLKFSEEKPKNFESLLDVSSTVGEKQQIKVLTLQLFDVTPNINESFINNEKEIVTITNNQIQSSQGSSIKEKGIFYFGKQDKGSNSDKLDYNFFNDEYIQPNQFEICYNDIENKYYISEGKQSSGLFLKIKECLKIHNGLILNYSNNNTMKFILDACNNDCSIEFLEGEFKGNIFSFNSTDYKTVRLGRAQTNEIISKNNSVSRIQWMIVFKKNNWMIYDGGFEKENNYKPSSNGLWLLVLGKSEIIDGAIWKTGGNKILSKID